MGIENRKVSTVPLGMVRNIASKIWSQKMLALHRMLGLVLAVFVAMHLGNHIALFWGAEQHGAVQDVLRKIYRITGVEALIALGFAVQLVLGLRLLLRRGWPERFWPRVQWLSGGVFVAFIVQHIGAVFYTRAVTPDIDTDIYWAARVVSQMPSAAYFVPYYTLGIVAIFAHFAAFVAIRKRRRRTAWLIIVVAWVFAMMFVWTLTGAFFPIA